MAMETHLDWLVTQPESRKANPRLHQCGEEGQLPAAVALEPCFPDLNPMLEPGRNALTKEVLAQPCI